MTVQILLFVVFCSCCDCEYCPLWTSLTNKTDSGNSNAGECACGDDLGGVVYCNPETLKVSLLYCFCMTYNSLTNETLVGQCYEGYFFKDTAPESNDSNMINVEMCGE